MPVVVRAPGEADHHASARRRGRSAAFMATARRRCTVGADNVLPGDVHAPVPPLRPEQVQRGHQPPSTTCSRLPRRTPRPQPRDTASGSSAAAPRASAATSHGPGGLRDGAVVQRLAAGRSRRRSGPRRVGDEAGSPGARATAWSCRPAPPVGLPVLVAGEVRLPAWLLPRGRRCCRCAGARRLAGRPARRHEGPHGRSELQCPLVVEPVAGVGAHGVDQAVSALPGPQRRRRYPVRAAA